MHVELSRWRFWDQTRSVENALAASLELSRARRERDEIDAFVARALSGRLETQSA
ncbi:hypothetical protein [Nocardioides pocheonensis]|jgi:hypothetical protein|uniref:hypothetical protein n=1 Tax=Nocardioides pocheonensis TaxID=661485 RepID=UPI00161D31DF|nr:hypothetical protein [Nocardioides pocheonensis]